MKQVQLKHAMRLQHLSITDDGFTIQNGAGRANYDKFGLRTTVDGIPEYFPMTLAIDNRIATEVISVGEANLGGPIKIGIEIDTTDAQKALDELDDKIRNSDVFKVLNGGWSFEKDGTLSINNGQVFITDAKIGDGVLSTNYSVKMGVNRGGKQYEAGMALGVEDGKPQVAFTDENLEVHEAASSIIGNAVATSTKTKISLSDEMKQAVIDAANDAIRSALKPGGLFWNARSRGI
ncbi:DUF1983 domain-containing protein [Enterobacter cancerogenus]|uniref:phage tail tip fiber protein n=1 Tax=Enterobacter cancerogenus TaxID=69218 RepID=UPI00384D41C9